MENKTLNTVIAIATILIFSVIVLVSTVFSTNNHCNSLEKGIKAQFEQNKNNYDNYFKSLKETAQVPSMYTEDLKKVYDSCMNGRYGANGSKAVLQFITEHNPNFDASLYSKIQTLIEAGRNKFEANQKDLISRKQTYETYLGSLPGGWIAGMMGFPKIDLEKYKIVTSTETEKQFNSGTSDPINLRPSNTTPEKEK